MPYTLLNIETKASPPETFDQAMDVIKELLRDRKLIEAIDETSSSSPQAGLTVQPPAAKPLPTLPAGASAGDMAAVLSALAAIDTPQAKAAFQALAAGVADPRKDGAGSGDKLKIPRGADGKPNKWVEGMRLCACGINGGKHLFGDCPLKKQKEKEAKDLRESCGPLPRGQPKPVLQLLCHCRNGAEAKLSSVKPTRRLPPEGR